MTLTALQRGLLAEARRATLATIGPSGEPRLVPVCYIVEDDADVLWIPLDAKPKSVSDPRRLARVRDIQDRSRVTLLVDRWSEDWSELAWLRLDGDAALVEAPDVPPAVVEGLVRRYPQYVSHGLADRPAIRVSITAVRLWSAAGKL